MLKEDLKLRLFLWISWRLVSEVRKAWKANGQVYSCVHSCCRCRLAPQPSQNISNLFISVNNWLVIIISFKVEFLNIGEKCTLWPVIVHLDWGVCVWAQTTKPVYTFDKDQEKDKECCREMYSTMSLYTLIVSVCIDWGVFVTTNNQAGLCCWRTLLLFQPNLSKICALSLDDGVWLDLTKHVQFLKTVFLLGLLQLGLYWPLQGGKRISKRLAKQNMQNVRL